MRSIDLDVLRSKLNQRKLDEREMDMAWARKAKEDMRKADERWRSLENVVMS